MKYKYALLKQEDKLVVYLNEKEKPQGEEYMEYPQISPDEQDCVFNEQAYKHDLEKWIENHKRFEVHKDYVKPLEHLSMENYLSNVFTIHPSWEVDIKKGIEISSERIWIKTRSENECVCAIYRDGVCCICPEYAVLRTESNIEKSLQEVWGDDKDGKYEELYSHHKSKDSKCVCIEPILYLPSSTFCAHCGNIIEENVKINDKSGDISKGELECNLETIIRRNMGNDGHYNTRSFDAAKDCAEWINNNYDIKKKKG